MYFLKLKIYDLEKIIFYTMVESLHITHVRDIITKFSIKL